MGQERVFGEHEGAPEGSGPFLGSTAVFPELDVLAELRSVKLSVASNGPNLLVEFEVPTHAVAAIAQLDRGITLEWADEKGKHGRLIGVGASLQRATLSPDPDGDLRHRVVYRLSQTQIPSALGVVGAGIHTDSLKGRLRIRSDQASLNLAARA